MIHFILALIFGVLMGCSSGGGSGGSDNGNSDSGPGSTEHIEWIGHYHGMGWLGDHSSQVADHSNMMNVNLGGNLADDRAMLDKAISLDLSPLVHRDPRSLFLTADWQARRFNETAWLTYVELLTPYVNELAGIYIFDEPTHNGIPYDLQVWVVNMYREAFPDVDLWATYLKIDRVPFELNMVSVTPDYNNWSARDYRKAMDTMYKKMHDHQLFYITTPAFSTKTLSTGRREWIADNVWDYYMLAKRDSRAVAVLHFLWASGKHGYGAQSLPLTQVTLKNIGEDLSNG